MKSNLLARLFLGILLSISACGKNADEYYPFESYDKYNENYQLRDAWLKGNGLPIKNLADGLYIASDAKNSRIPILKIQVTEENLWNSNYQFLNLSIVSTLELGGDSYLNFADEISTNLIADYEVQLGGGSSHLGMWNIHLASSSLNLPIAREYWRTDSSKEFQSGIDYSSIVLANDRILESSYKIATSDDIEKLFEGEIKTSLENTFEFSPNQTSILKTRSICVKLTGLDCARWIRDNEAH